MSDLPFFLHNVFFSLEIENIWYLLRYRNTQKVWKNSKMLWKHFYLWFVFHSIALTPKLLLVFLKLNKTWRFNTWLRFLKKMLPTIHSNIGHFRGSGGLNIRICCITEVHPFIWFFNSCKFNFSRTVNRNASTWCNKQIVMIPANWDLDRKTDRRDTVHADNITNYGCLVAWILNKSKIKI